MTAWCGWTPQQQPFVASGCSSSGRAAAASGTAGRCWAPSAQGSRPRLQRSQRAAASAASSAAQPPEAQRQRQRALPPPAPPPPSWQTQQPGQPAAGQTSHTQELYSSSAAPITSFGFARGFSDKYELAEQLGSGTFGIVHVAVNRETGERWVGGWVGGCCVGGWCGVGCCYLRHMLAVLPLPARLVSVCWHVLPSCRLARPLALPRLLPACLAARLPQVCCEEHAQALCLWRPPGALLCAAGAQ